MSFADQIAADTALILSAFGLGQTLTYRRIDTQAETSIRISERSANPARRSCLVRGPTPRRDALDSAIWTAANWRHPHRW
jgi:hypothetical protein